MSDIGNEVGGTLVPPHPRLYFDGFDQGLPVLKAKKPEDGIINNILANDKTPLNKIINYDETNAKTLKANKRRWLENSKTNGKNYPDMGKNNSLGKFQGYLANKPSILIGAGPSLKKNAHLLKDSGITTFAVMHALPYLNKIGFTPDFVVHADAMATDAEFITEDSKDITLIAHTIVAPAVIRKWKGDVVFYKGFASDEFGDKINDVVTADTTIKPMGCSMAAAMNVAEELMMSTSVIFIGNDLCYDDKDGSHVWDGLNYNTNELVGVAPLTTKGTIAGDIEKTVTTCYQFILYRQNIQNYTQARRMVPPYKRFINATEGGILLLPETMTLKEALKSVEDTPDI